MVKISDTERELERLSRLEHAICNHIYRMEAYSDLQGFVSEMRMLIPELMEDWERREEQKRAGRPPTQQIKVTGTVSESTEPKYRTITVNQPDEDN